MEGKNEYEVGHRRPPKHTRFKPGISGNPKGRPRSRKNLATVFDAASNERVSVIENGKRKTITMLEAIMKQVTRKAAGGDQPALRLFVDLHFRLHPEGKEGSGDIELMRELAAETADYFDQKKPKKKERRKKKPKVKEPEACPDH